LLYDLEILLDLQVVVLLLRHELCSLGHNHEGVRGDLFWG
jgi:hypothetical protein